MAEQGATAKGRSGSNVPAEVTSFIGRRHELARIRQLLADARLVTVIGPGGVGKTRLAIRAAAQLHRAFADGVWLVELAVIRTPDLIPSAIATSLGLRADDPKLRERLARFLEGKSVLLVLDNCEHLADECAALLGKLLAAAPGLRVLVTSRQRLGVEGETLLQVEPLDSAGSASDAVALFAERAAPVSGGFHPDEREMSVIVDICRRLDGLPLAVELAAVWTRTLSVEEILDRLDDRFRLLDSGRLHVVPRQRRLRALVDWSFDLCTREERLLWRRSAVFEGGFDLAAAEAVCSGEGIDSQELLVHLAGLLDKSILARDAGSFGGHARYRMLETTQAYGLARLEEADEVRRSRERHLAYFTRLARQCEEARFGSGQLDWVQRLQREHANLRAALEFCLSAPDQVQRGFELCSSLFIFWESGGHLAEGHRWLARALAPDPVPTAARARALRTCLTMAVHLGIETGLAEMAAEYRQIVASVDDPELHVGLAECSALVALLGGDIDTAYQQFEEALAGRRELGDRPGEADVLSYLTIIDFVRGRERANARTAELLALCEPDRPHWYTAIALMLSGVAAARRGEWPVAEELQKQALRLRWPMRDHSGLAAGVEVLSWCAAARNRLERAVRLQGAAEMLWQLSGARTGAAFVRGMDDGAAARARSGLPPDRAAYLFAEGQRFTLDEAFAYALEGQAADETSPTPRQASQATLTKREREVAELVADGLSNKDVAERLVISIRTAETHVEHILTKLGYRSRGRIAAWVAEQRDLADPAQ